MGVLDNLSLYCSVQAVDVWAIDLDLEPEQIAELERSLSGDERIRADRFHFARDRSRFVAARGSLREILGHYLDIPPAEVQFTYTSTKKPQLADDETLRFNVSHSENLALIAVTQSREIGIDLEALRTDFDPDALAKRFFSPDEYAALTRTPPSERHTVFLAYWTCKEAYLKALGTGLRLPLNQFTVSLENQAITRSAPTRGGVELAPYHLAQIYPAPGYVAALVIETPVEG